MKGWLAVRPVARVTDTHVGVCSHGAPCCPHNVAGTIFGCSLTTVADGLGVARFGYLVVHDCPHCGIGSVASGCGNVTADGIPVARLGDMVVYPGGEGTIITGSGTVTCC